MNLPENILPLDPISDFVIVMFIPMFFLIIGALIDPASFSGMQGTDYIFVSGLVLLLILAKYFAARVTSAILHYNRAETNIMWSLSIPQVAATLAAALVAYQTTNSDGERLISKMVFDSILILMAVTTVLGPLLSEYFAKKLKSS